MAAAAKITERGTDGIAVEAATPASQPGDVFPAGTIVDYAGSAAPTGWLICDGSVVSRATYPTLFANIGTTFGAGDGSTTFGIPDCRGKIPVGKHTSGTFVTLGGTGGEENHTLTTNEIPSHNHGGATQVESVTHAHGGVLVDSGLRMSTTTTGSGWIIPGIGTSGNASQQHVHAINAQGGGATHNNMPPYIVLNKIIRAY